MEGNSIDDCIQILCTQLLNDMDTISSEAGTPQPDVLFGGYEKMCPGEFWEENSQSHQTLGYIYIIENVKKSFAYINTIVTMHCQDKITTDSKDPESLENKFNKWAYCGGMLD